MLFRSLWMSVLSFIFVVPALGDTWVDSTGEFSVDAEFVGLKDNVVRLRRANGKTIDVALSKLSRPDQQKARRLAASVALKDSNTPAPTRPTDGKKATPASSNDDLLNQISAKAQPQWGTSGMRDRNGNQVPPQLILGIELTGKPAEEATHFGHVTLNDYSADGHRLERKMAFFKDKDISRAYEKIKRDAIIPKHPANGVLVPVQFKNPGIKAKLATYRGVLKLKTGGETTVVSIGNLEKTDGKPIPNRHLKSAGIVCKVRPAGTRTVRMDLKGNLDLIQSVLVANKAGKKHGEYTGGGSGGGDNDYSYDFDFKEKVPDDAVINLTLRTKTVEINVPFDFRDVKIAASRN